jgi:hypothetical protein
MNRRSFFGLLPMLPAMAAAAVVKETQAGDSPEDAFTHSTLELRTTYGNVAMAVGKDGKLWTKSHNKEWKRVVTE